METLEQIVKESAAAIKSGTAAVHIAGDDYSQINEFIEALKDKLGCTDTVEWNNGYGAVTFKTVKPVKSGQKQPLVDFLEEHKTWPNDEGIKKIVVVRNARHVLDGEMNRENLARLQQTILHYKQTMNAGKSLGIRAALVYCDEKRYIPDELASLVYYAELKPPSHIELDGIIKTYIEKHDLTLDDKTRIQLSSMCVGMSKDSFTQILEKTRIHSKEEFGTYVLSEAGKAKKNFVDKSGLLKYIATEDTKINDVGGLETLKWWVNRKREAYDRPEDARKSGISPAKGILLAGMPGCGKTLSAKAIAHHFRMPLLQLDMGSLMGKYQGESEENLRRALTLAEHSSPCVLWVDEIEKAFAGLQGDESGVSQRLFGYLLTWLNDKTAWVFVVATANDISSLPSEFLRRGRFDEIFRVDFPLETERKDIFHIHLKKALNPFIQEQKIDIDIEALAKEMAGKDKTEGFAGSDIASLISSAVEIAWSDNQIQRLPEILKKELKWFKPLKLVLEDKIAANLEKFKKYHLVSASTSEEDSHRFETDSEGSEERKIAVAQDEKCPEPILKKLEKNGSPKVKCALISNPRCSGEMLERLQHDKDEEVRKSAVKKLVEMAGKIQKEYEAKQTAKTGSDKLCTTCKFFQRNQGCRRGLTYQMNCPQWEARG